MSKWSTTYRWGGYSRSDARGLVNHDVRQPGVTQSNPQVDSSRTALNMVRVADGKGGLRELRSGENGTKTVMDHLDAVLARSKKNTRQHKVMKRNPDTGKNEPTSEVVEKEIAIRKDASVMVELVMQLDPEFTGTGYLYGDEGKPVWKLDEDGTPLRDEGGNRIQEERTCADMTPEELQEASELLDVMIQEAIEQHETSEMLYITKHFDETHPHVQMAFVPLTKDGRVNSTEVLAGGKRQTKAAAQKAYAAKHDQMREALQDAGYEATFERVDDGKKHKNLSAHKREKDHERRLAQEREDAQEALIEGKIDIRVRESGLNAGVRQLQRDQAKLQQERGELEQQNALLQPLVAEIEQGQADLKQEQDKFKHDHGKFEQQKEAFKQERFSWFAEELPKLREKGYADAKAEVEPAWAKLKEQAIVELNKQSQRLRAVPSDVEAWLDATPNARAGLQAFQQRRAEPQPVRAIRKELSIFDTFRADVHDNEPNDNRDRQR